MKKMKKIALMLVAVMMVSVLGGCGNSFDASAYMKAVLDNSYKNDSSGFIDLKVGTKEEASKVYEEGIDKEMESLTAQVQLSEDLEKEFREVFKDVLKNVKYTVGEAEKKDDGSYEVKVKYEKMNIFAPSVAAFQEKSAEYVQEMTEKAMNGEETPSEDELNEKVFGILKECMEAALPDVTYEKEAEATVRIELKDKVYTPNEEDVTNLELLLFDTDAMSALQ